MLVDFFHSVLWALQSGVNSFLYSIIAQSIASLCLPFICWRLWSFRLSPLLHTSTAKEVPYWIPGKPSPSLCNEETDSVSVLGSIYFHEEVLEILTLRRPCESIRHRFTGIDLSGHVGSGRAPDYPDYAS